MARRTFTEVDDAWILMQWHAGSSTREVARRSGVDPKTVRRYVAPAMAAGLAPGQPKLGEETWRTRVREWFPQVANPRLRQPTWYRIAPHHERIRRLVGQMPVSAIHRRLRDEVGLDTSVASLRRYVRANFDPAARRSRHTGARRR